MNKRTYYRLCRTMPRDWLAAAIAAPSPYQTPMSLLIARLALRDGVSL